MFYAYRFTMSGEEFFIIAPSPAFNTFFRQTAPEDEGFYMEFHPLALIFRLVEKLKKRRLKPRIGRPAPGSG